MWRLVGLGTQSERQSEERREEGREGVEGRVGGKVGGREGGGRGRGRRGGREERRGGREERRRGREGDNITMYFSPVMNRWLEEIASGNKAGIPQGVCNSYQQCVIKPVTCLFPLPLSPSFLPCTYSLPFILPSLSLFFPLPLLPPFPPPSPSFLLSYCRSL